MAKTLEQVLGYVSLTGVINEVKTGIPKNVPEQFWSITKDVLGNVGLYTRVQGTRKTASMTNYGSPAKRRDLKGLDTVPVKLLHAFEEIQLDPLLLQRVRSYDSYENDAGMQEVDRQLSLFRQHFDNLDISSVYSMLANGAIYIDEEGNLLPSSSGASRTIDFQISADNQDQLNGIITASWATSTTDIPLQLRNLRIRAAELTGYPLKYAFYGVNVPSYMTVNNYVLDYLARSPNYATKFLETAEIPDGLFGFTWVPVYTSFYEDADGTNQTFFGGDTVVFTPEINMEVYEWLKGSYMVPGSLNIQTDALAAIRSMRQVQGMFSYATVTLNPPGVKMFAGNTFLPTWKVADSLFIADVTP